MSVYRAMPPDDKGWQIGKRADVIITVNYLDNLLRIITTKLNASCCHDEDYYDIKNCYNDLTSFLDTVKRKDIL